MRKTERFFTFAARITERVSSIPWLFCGSSEITAEREEFQRALTDEARVLVHLKHPNIVDIYDLNFEAENPYMVMEYIDGTELRDLLKSLSRQGQRMPLAEVLFIILEVSKALSHAHGRNDPQTGEPFHIVHRDVSPSNILISSQGDVKLSDFGIAKSSLQSGRTQVGQIKGKFRYMSPEQAMGGVLDHRSDIFSLGLVFYECLLGVPAYGDTSDVRILQMARSGEIHYAEGIDPVLQKILSRLLCVTLQGRYAELGEFRKDLLSYMASQKCEMDREGLATYLEGLKLAKVQEAISVRQEAEDWKPKAATKVLDRTGIITSLEIPSAAQRWRRSVGVSALVILAAGLLFWMSPQGRRYLGRELRPSVAQGTPSGVNGTPPPVLQAKVKFNAEPYASVSIPGQFSNLETPFTKNLSPQEYEVIFVHKPSGRKVTALLKASQGGTFSCTADMGINLSPATARCQSRSL